MSDLNDHDRDAAAAPHVVLIFMDDMTHWVLTDPAVHTPHLDRLRQQSVHFRQAVNQGSTIPAVCLPARQMLLSGLTLFHAQDQFAAVPRIGSTLRDHGYRTCFTGKWHNEESVLTEDYEVVGAHAVGGMFPAGPSAYARPPENDDYDPSDPGVGGHWLTATQEFPAQHSSERWADSALQMLATDDPRPFFLHVAFHAPHDPRQAPLEYLERYPREQIAVPPNAWPAHPFDNGELDVRDEHLAPWPRTAEAVQLHRQEYAAIVTHADAQIGRILDAVEARTDPRSTVVVFSGDHGLALGEHGLLGKQSLYDHSTRVPLMVAAPWIDAGECDALVYSGSIYPTICDLVGVPRPEHIEFHSLIDELACPTCGGEAAQLGVYRDLMRCVRRRDHKLIHYLHSGRRQLFDLAKDPHEMVDLADDPSATTILTELDAELTRLRHSVDDPLLSTT